MDFDQVTGNEIFDIVSETHKSFLKRLQPQNDQLEMQATSISSICEKSHNEYVERWEKLQQLQQTVTTEMERLWNKQSENNVKRDELKCTVEELKEKLARLNDQLKSHQTNQKNLRVEIEQINGALIDLARTVLVTNPREEFMNQLLTNITKIKWSNCNSELSESVKGVVFPSSQPPRKFQFNPHQQSPETICSEIWDLLTEGDTFLK